MNDPLTERGADIAGATRLHDPIPAVRTWLRSVVGGHIGYSGVSTNGGAYSMASHCGERMYPEHSRPRAKLAFTRVNP